METYFHNLSPEENYRCKLVQDLKMAAQDLERLLLSSTQHLGEQARTEIFTTLEKLKTASRKAEEETYIRAKKVDLMIQKNPYPAIGVAFLAGLALGMVLFPKDKD